MIDLLSSNAAGRKLLISALNYWNSPFQVSSHFIAREMARRGWTVLYLSAPITPLHLMRYKKADLGQRLRSYQAGVISDRESGVLHYVPGAFLAPGNHWSLRSSLLIGNWPSNTMPSLKKVLEDAMFASPDVLYVDTFLHASLSKITRPQISCYHMADDYSAFPGYGGDFQAAETQLCQDADVVICPSHGIEDRAKQLGASNTLFLPNGVDVEYFDENAQLNSAGILFGVPKPIAIYVGALDGWFDFDLIAFCADKLPAISFVLAGPLTSVPRGIRSRTNVYCIGPTNRAQTRSCLNDADVGLIPFDVGRFRRLIDPIRPLKLLEYFASGLPVVSVDWSEIRKMKAPVYLATNREEFVNQIQLALSIEGQAEMRKEYVREFSWRGLAESLEQRIALELRQSSGR